MILVLRGRDRGANQDLFDQLFAFRYEIFVRDRGWAVSDAHGPGTDRYDDDDAVYFIDIGDDRRIRASARITPTVTSSMIADHLPQLISDGNAARGPAIYELNRQVLLSERDGCENVLAATRLLECAIEWCLAHRVTHLQTFIDAEALPAYLDLSPLLVPLGLPLPYRGGPGKPGGGSCLGIRWPVCGQLLVDIGRYHNSARAKADLARADKTRKPQPKFVQ